MSEPATLDTVVAAAVRRTASGVALICGEAMTVSPLIEGTPAGGGEAEIYAAVAAAILRHSEFSVVLHPGTAAAERAPSAAIRRASELLPNTQGRLRVIAAEPLERLFPGVDLLVSFASPSLIAGCRAGLKPVQIGRRMIGSTAFSHFFPNPAGFAAALAGGDIAGGLSLREYELFDAFCRRIGNDRLRPLAARDSIVRACRPPRRTCRRALRSLLCAFSNPFAVWRLLRAAFGATNAR